jgi:hypothetical protein
MSHTSTNILIHALFSTKLVASCAFANTTPRLVIWHEEPQTYPKARDALPALLLSVLLLPVLSVCGHAQTIEIQARIDAHVTEYRLSSTSLADAILRIAKQFELPAGIEWVKQKETSQSLQRVWRNTTVGEIVRAVVDAYPPYSFRVEAGMVHLYRPDLLNDSHNFLNLKVPDFYEVRQEAGGLADVELREVAQDIVSPRKLPPGAGVGGSYTSGNVSEKPLTLDLRGLTIREALERLAEASEHKMWVVTFSGGTGLTPTGFFRTETLWHPTPFPDRDQPMWDFLAWQEFLPSSTAIPQDLPR